MRKRAHALLLSICLALSLTVPAQAAGTELAINAPDKLPDVGETFTVTVDISNNPGFSALQFTLTYDDDVLECISADAEQILASTLYVTNPEAPDGAIVAAAAASRIRGDGALASFTFQVVGKGDLKFGLADSQLSDLEGNPISYQVEGAKMVSASDEKPSAEKPKEETKPSAEVVPTTGGRFTDTGGHPSETFIYEAVDRGFFQGYSDGSFKPNGNVTRGAFVTVLWRMAGRPEPSGTTPFTDIGNVSAEFQKAIAWAYNKGYINGRTATTFAPGDSMSRQATMKILFNHYGGGSGEELMYYGIYDSYFTDSSALNEQFKAPMYWGLYHGLIEGKTDTTIGGPTVADRALLATTLVKYTDRFG